MAGKLLKLSNEVRLVVIPATGGQVGPLRLSGTPAERVDFFYSLSKAQNAAEILRRNTCTFQTQSPQVPGAHVCSHCRMLYGISVACKPPQDLLPGIGWLERAEESVH